MWPNSLPYFTFCLCTTFALTIANKDDTIYPYVGYGAGPTEDIVAFREANTSPNATGIVDLEVYNLRANLDSVQNVLWQATLNVTEVTNLNYTDAATDVITNSVIGINALENWVENSTWTTTIFILEISSRNVIVSGQRDTGNCYATLGETCVQEYLNNADLTNISAQYPTSPSIPTNCDDKIAGSYGGGFNGSDADGSGYFFSASWVHNASNTTFYENAVTKIWPLLVIQRNEAHGIQTASLSCLKANATMVGSKAIGGVPSVATGFQIYGWVVMAVASAVGLMFL
ncbi:uncharacterized protein Bfra_008302ca [Botrytis fragariae]|uniref:Uncharacterized protein n=1 Tax=Botrytis fragariae TaxID=1964551 RepID=A0A8H6ATA2_9HELO|nr:uncharacterized protein Bfra_008302ca [Botrytis fragariae]KAF5873025.1 hypothetical protein Bfra_008302ca [Botrytis fragariae]